MLLLEGDALTLFEVDHSTCSQYQLVERALARNAKSAEFKSQLRTSFLKNLEAENENDCHMSNQNFQGSYGNYQSVL